jgi:hypothetical protein
VRIDTTQLILKRRRHESKQSRWAVGDSDCSYCPGPHQAALTTSLRVTLSTTTHPAESPRE